MAAATAAVVALAGAGAELLGGLVHPFKGCTYDADAAERVIRFFRHLHHSKGEWAGQPFEPDEWQARILRAIFGWKRPDGTRLIRTVYLEIPRKNGKSTLVAGLALYLAVADNESVAEVFGAASDEEQAKEVFDEAVRMVRASSGLSDVCTVFTTSIYVAENGSSYKLLTKRPEGKHGKNPHGVVIDELHAIKNRELVDALTTAQGARRQPLTVFITTAGYDRASVCWEYHDYAEKVADGIIDDPSFLGIIYAAGPDDDWREEKTWAKANPGLGVSPKLEYLREKFTKAQSSPAAENVFKRLFLNIWTEAESRWLPDGAWDLCAGEPVLEEELQGRECWGGVDLSNTQDIASLVWVFPRIAYMTLPGREEEEAVEVYDVLPRLWLPRDSADKRLRNNRVPYPQWAQEGYLHLIPGNVIDHQYIEEQLLADCEAFRVREVAYDPFLAGQFASKMFGDHQVPMLKHRQGFLEMGGPTKVLEAMVLSKRVRHGGNPVMRWAASNVVVRQDPAGNIKPDKSKAFEKIDPIVALIMALGRATMGEGGSVYDERGVVAVDL